MLPENETLPISAESTIARLVSTWRLPGAGMRVWNSAIEISAAAPPPTPLNSATICGIAVIFTRRAATAPKPPPRTIPSPISQKLPMPFWANVTTIASSMPAAPTWLPRLAVAGDERKRRARMKVTIVTR